MESRHYKEAKKRVKKKKKFYNHLTIWLIVSFFLFALNLFTSPWHMWAFYPFMGWGMAVAFQAYEVFSMDWEDRQIQQEMRKLSNYEEADDIEQLELEDEIELKEFKKLRNEWNDSDFV